VTLAIGDAHFSVASVGKRMNNVRKVPLIVRLVFEEFDPHIGYGHGQTVIEANPPLRNGHAKKGHTRNVLGDGDNRGIE
jgi:hypothetical protein